jgi:voltage-gated potassium channel Kch
MQPSWREKFSYQFDNFMSKGTAALIGGLGVLSLILIAFIAFVITLTGIAPGGGAPISFLEAAWLSLMRTLDAGTMGGDEGWSFRLIMFVVTLGGVFVISTLIGVLTSGIEAKMDDLRKGRSRVIERNHTVILGWSTQIFTILSELIVANENQSHSCIVILGDRDKVEMEEEIHTVIGDSKRTRIVCRKGNPIDMNDLHLVSLDTARSIIVPASETSDPDAQTIKTVLAITNNPKRRSEPYHIVAEIKDSKNLDVARMVGKDEVELILAGNLISRIIAQTCRQSGLSVVYTELLDFDGDEIYFKEEPALVGMTFHDILSVYKTSTVLGLWSPEIGSRLNPAMDTRVASGDRAIVVSKDDDTIVLERLKTSMIQAEAIVNREAEPPTPERTLVLGWNWRAPSIINELDMYVAPGSEVTLVADFEQGDVEISRLCADLKNQVVSFRFGDTTDRRVLEGLEPHTYHHVIVLSYAGTKDIQASDACTLITLLHLRDMADKSGEDFAIVSEMLDVQNRALAEVTQADDFIVSDRIISLLMTQVSENKALNAVFTDIFDPDGSEIYLKPASRYVSLGVPVNLYTVVESASRRSEVVLGYRLKSQSSDAAKAYGVYVNPDKSNRVTFTAEDTVIVLAEN